MHESNETTHFSVVDSAGNAVSNTYTLNGAFGSGVIIPGTGFLMNNEMDDFTSAIGIPNMYGLLQGEANAIAPGKRPTSSMTPTFVFKDGRLVLITGSPGGPTIINTVLQVITNVIDFRMEVQRAVDAPRINEQWMPDVISYERLGLSLIHIFSRLNTSTFPPLFVVSRRSPDQLPFSSRIAVSASESAPSSGEINSVLFRFNTSALVQP